MSPKNWLVVLSPDAGERTTLVDSDCKKMPIGERLQEEPAPGAHKTLSVSITNFSTILKQLSSKDRESCETSESNLAYRIHIEIPYSKHPFQIAIVVQEANYPLEFR